MKVYKIDLHRMRHEDARRAVIRFVEDHWSETAELEIITGNSTQMKGVVINVLDEYNLTYNIGRMFDTANKGYVVVYMEY